MFKIKLLLTLALLLTAVGQPWAASKDLLSFDLSLAGYRLGMTYDEALLVRPFDIVTGTPTDQMGEYHYTASVDHLFVDDVELSVEVLFAEGKATRILCRFSPAELDGMFARLRIAMGPGQDKSRVVKDKYDDGRRQMIYRWDFPNAQVNLISLSSTQEADFAVVSLVTKKESAVDAKDH